MPWFLELLDELGMGCWGHPVKIRAAETRKQKYDGHARSAFSLGGCEATLGYPGQVGSRLCLNILPLLMPYRLVTLERSPLVFEPEH